MNSTTTAARKPAIPRLHIESGFVPPFVTLITVTLLGSLFVPQFATMRTISGIVSGTAINAMVVIGVTLLMVAGEFDLSVGATMAMGGYVFATNIVHGGSPVVAVVLALLVSGILGTVNGLLVIWARIPSFIVTLGTASIYRAAVWIVSGGLMVQTTERLPAVDLINGRLDVVNQLFTQANFRTSVVWVLAVGLLVQFVLVRTRFGSHVFAVGGNAGAATTQGVNVNLVKVSCFAITGALAGVAGILTFSEFSTIFVATGLGVELTAIAAAVVGGTLLTGGSGNIIGGLIGVVLIEMLRTGVILMGLPSDNFEAIVGVTIIGAVVLNNWLSKRA